MSNSSTQTDAQLALEFLNTQRNGRTLAELGAALRVLSQAVSETGKKGSVSLTITAAPATKFGNQIIISDKVVAKAPEHDRDNSLFFVSNDGGLSRNDPRQFALPLLEVGAQEQPLREVVVSG